MSSENTARLRGRAVRKPQARSTPPEPVEVLRAALVQLVGAPAGVVPPDDYLIRIAAEQAARRREHTLEVERKLAESNALLVQQRDMIATLRRELEVAWAETDGARTRERIAVDSFDSLLAEVRAGTWED